MRRIGGAIQCAFKASDMNRADDAMSGYAALTRPTRLKNGGDYSNQYLRFQFLQNKKEQRHGETCH